MFVQATELCLSSKHLAEVMLLWTNPVANGPGDLCAQGSPWERARDKRAREEGASEYAALIDIFLRDPVRPSSVFAIEGSRSARQELLDIKSLQRLIFFRNCKGKLMRQEMQLLQCL
ncbi:hypothetical protein GOP47_0006445 [Adiantum capillus-veneris]|uniref:Uncharacterized protein n=1 Tax=Adiantum capillus-veneris TaxID=13818 RepID=A0A9D4ZKE6_ADICA|nr:hypothetical protein GOP47_0006445 [Adiantum capillus-veneris]